MIKTGHSPRFVNLPAWSACGLIAIFALSSIELASSLWVQWTPWIASLAIFGLAHGAMDHKVWLALKNPVGKRANYLLAFVSCYLLLTALVASIWIINPQLSLAVFLLASAFHFGQGDVYWSGRYGFCAETDHYGYKRAFLLVRGALPIFLPVLAFPEHAVRLFSIGDGAFAMWLCGESARAALISLLIVGIGWQIMAALAGSLFAGANARLAVEEGAETLLLAGLFTVTPPVLSIGTYFFFWHSHRHIARLIPLLEPESGRSGISEYLRVLTSYHKRGLPMATAAFVLLLTLICLVKISLILPDRLPGLAIIFISSITVPHVLLVLWMDVKQEVWRRRTAC